MTTSGSQTNALDVLALAIRRLAPWLVLLCALWLVRDTAARLSGKHSGVELWIMWMSSAKVTRLSAFIFGVAGVLFGLQQRSLRRSEQDRMGRRLEQLEARLGAEHRS